MPGYSVDAIFRNPDTRHRLTLFTTDDVSWLEGRIFDRGGRPYVRCLGSERDRLLKPEEVVRQLWLRRLIEDYHYPRERIQVEREVQMGEGVSEKSADIVVLHADREHALMIIEVKKPSRRDGIKQLKSYCNAEGSPIGVWSNGEEVVILHRQEPNIFSQISAIPALGQTLQDVIAEPWTIDKLTQENRLVRERLSLKKIILDLEDLVLANAEGIDDSFDEVFKLIYAKLYDEWAAVADRSRARRIMFRIYGETPAELLAKINGLFERAKNKWNGIFSADDRIRLKAEHLVTCVSFLQDVRLFNANLQVIDEAFEYLITQVAKGKKGQYFTPRWVIDMCVKMLNPKIDERVIDTACGSSGFTAHSIFWVAGQQFTAGGLAPEYTEYAGSMVFAIDSSPKAVKIAKALNLIAGDGKSNVYELNSLNPPKWTDEGKAAFRPRLLRFAGDVDRTQENEREFQFFDFDVLMTNPPFAGNIGEREILRQYRLAERDGRTVARMGRDVLFVERNLRFLKPGGRMAIVLPQGRLNNAGDLYIRDFMFTQGRVLAVVSLHVNTFKPHTGTKTSVVFLQKYTDAERAEAAAIREGHEVDWEQHLAELRRVGGQEAVVVEELPDRLRAYLTSEFDSADGGPVVDAGDGAEELVPTEDELIERIAGLQARLETLPPRAAGRANLVRALGTTRKQLAAKSVGGRLRWLLGDAGALSRYREGWLAERAAVDLNYPIFFAVSERPGKDSSGEMVWRRDEAGEPLLDAHGHLVVDTDVDEIADAFVVFAREQRMGFWVEG